MPDDGLGCGGRGEEAGGESRVGGGVGGEDGVERDDDAGCAVAPLDLQARVTDLPGVWHEGVPVAVVRGATLLVVVVIEDLLVEDLLQDGLAGGRVRGGGVGEQDLCDDVDPAVAGADEVVVHELPVRGAVEQDTVDDLGHGRRGNGAVGPVSPDEAEEVEVAGPAVEVLVEGMFVVVVVVVVAARKHFG